MNAIGIPTHRHPYVKIKHLKDEIPRLLAEADSLTGYETTFGFEHRVKVWESDVPNRVEAKLLFTKSFLADGVLGYRLFGAARATTDLWDILCAFRSFLGDPVHLELTHRETMESLHPFPYDDEWIGFQVWWMLSDAKEAV